MINVKQTAKIMTKNKYDTATNDNHCPELGTLKKKTFVRAFIDFSIIHQVTKCHFISKKNIFLISISEKNEVYFSHFKRLHI